MKILLVYPKVTETFWSFKHVLKIVRRKAAFPPLGVLTVAAILPSSWEKRLVDLNVEELKDDDIQWADYVFISAMIAQRESVEKVVQRCKWLGVKTVGGGPLFNGFADDFPDIDHLVLGEGEVTIPLLVADLEAGSPRRLYQSKSHPSLTDTPIPAWDLIDLNNYATMCIQYSRGCPFNCEFCDIIVMNGRVPRSKSNGRILAELDALYERGWRGPVFVVDDNFIGNRNRVKELLKAIITWQGRRKKRLNFFTEASVDLAEDEELMDLMVRAGFNKVFLGLETPSIESLKECGKSQNLRLGLNDAVRTIQNHGLAVMGGFIIGFDNDPPDIFQRLVQFIQKTGTVTAMVGLLTAIPKTRLHKRLEREGRLLFKTSGDNTSVDGVLNFVPKMDRQAIIHGYQWVMTTIYAPEMYHKRILAFLRDYQPRVKMTLEAGDILAFIRSLWYLGVRDHHSRIYFWRLMKDSLLHYRSAFPDVVTMLVYGYHFRKLFWDGRLLGKDQELAAVREMP